MQFRMQYGNSLNHFLLFLVPHVIADPVDDKIAEWRTAVNRPVFPQVRDLKDEHFAFLRHFRHIENVSLCIFNP